MMENRLSVRSLRFLRVARAQRWVLPAPVAARRWVLPAPVAARRPVNPM